MDFAIFKEQHEATLSSIGNHHRLSSSFSSICSSSTARKGDYCVLLLVFSVPLPLRDKERDHPYRSLTFMFLRGWGGGWILFVSMSNLIGKSDYENGKTLSSLSFQVTIRSCSGAEKSGKEVYISECRLVIYLRMFQGSPSGVLHLMPAAPVVSR